MPSRLLLRWCSLVVVAAATACGSGETLAPSHEPPAQIAAVSDLIRASVVGTPIGGGISVKVTDASGRPVQGASVAFITTVGNGTTNPRIAVSDAQGVATTEWTLGTLVGTNQVAAGVDGVSTQLIFTATGNAGPVTTLSMSTRNARLLEGVDTVRITARALDAFGNSTFGGATFTVRDPSLVSVDGTGLVRALRRGSSTYVVAAIGAKSDSAL